MCVKELSLWETVTHQAAYAEHPMQVTVAGVEGSAPETWVKLLCHVSLLGFIVSNGQTVAGSKVPNPSLLFS